MMSSSGGRRKFAIAGAATIVVVILVVSGALYLQPNLPHSTTSGRSNPVSSFPSPAGLFSALANSGSVGTLSGGASSGTNAITVTGTGQVTFVPTEAIVGLSVVTQGATAAGAASSNAAATTAVIKALNSIGIANDSIQTSSYNLSPNYNYVQGSTPQITGYSVSNSLQVNVTGTSASRLGVRAGQVIDTGVGAGANQASLQFTAPNSALGQLQNQALKQAVADASSKAQTIAGALGVSITGVVSASTGSYYTPQPVYFAMAANSVSSTSTPIMPGTMTVSASVTVSYAFG